MKKEGSWISAFKRIFICSSEAKNINDSRGRSKEERGVRIRKQRCDDRSPFVTLFSGTSSIEKILKDVEKEQQLSIQTLAPSHEQETPASASAPVPLQPHGQSASLPGVSSICSPSPHPDRFSIKSKISTPSLSRITDTDHAALIIQTIYRGYMEKGLLAQGWICVILFLSEGEKADSRDNKAVLCVGILGMQARRSLRALKGLVRLQGVVRGQNVKRQTTSAMKYMQLLFRAHSQVGSWRGEMLDRLRVQRQQSISQIQIEGDGQREWDDSLLLKGETEARLQRKGEGFISRQRVLSYSYSHRVLNLLMAPSTETASSADVKRAGFRWWWNRLERRVPRGRMSTVKMSPRHSWPGDGHVATTPLPAIMRRMRVPLPLNNRQAQTYTPARSSYCSNQRTSTCNEDTEEEDESFTSCPHFSSSPNYMTPTVSAMAKARLTHITLQGRRLSYPLTPVVPSSKWNTALRSSISSSKESELRRALGGRQSPLFLADEGTFSSPTSVVRIPFNRFV